MAWRLQDLLQAQASKPLPGRLLFYPPGNTACPREISYKTLYKEATEAGGLLRQLGSFEKNKPVLLHLEDHWDTILWFWAVLLADGLPVLSSPFSHVEEHRRQHIQALAALLETPICITRSKSLPLFGADHGTHLYPIESLCEKTPVEVNGAARAPQDRRRPGGSSQGDNSETSGEALSMLMLTSGSTGNAKAVRLTHKQVLTSVAGKSSVRQLPLDKPFLNWIGLDHVGALVEIHLHALSLGVDQIHVNAVDIISSPRTFIDLLSHYRVSRSFAPNFFLARLISAIRSLDLVETRDACSSWNLSNLLFLVSGGEANDVKTCSELSSLLTTYGAPPNVITPGFGMTETCAGSIYNVNCPEYDMAKGRTVASLGKCIKGIEMRVAISEQLVSGTGTGLALAEQPGELQVRGPVVFQGYYRNTAATLKAFTPDGWFRTGDQAVIDMNGNLNLIGRTEDVININGIKVITSDMQTSLEQALGERVARLVVFATRAAHTE